MTMTSRAMQKSLAEVTRHVIRRHSRVKGRGFKVLLVTRSGRPCLRWHRDRLLCSAPAASASEAASARAAVYLRRGSGMRSGQTVLKK